MHPDLLALLTAIRDDPDDALPRLALADWCLEQPDRATQARGEYIHLALQRAAQSTSELSPLDAQLDDLESQYRRAWLGSLLQDTHRIGIDRGLFVAEVSPGSLSRASWERLGSRHAWPWVLTLIGRSFTANEVTSLCQSEAAEPISRLELPYSRPGREGIWALADTDSMPSLRALDLRNAQLGNEIAVLLMRSTPRPGLKRLGLFDTGLTPTDVSALAFGKLSSLVALNLGNNRIGDDGAISLGASANFANLTRLWLHNTEIGDAGVAALMRSPHLGRLQVLDLSRNRIGVEGIAALAGCPRTSNLVELNLSAASGPDLTASSGVGTILARSAFLGNLKTLNLDEIELSESDVLDLVDSPNLRQLESLRADRARLSTMTWLELRQRQRPRLVGAWI